MRVAIAGVLVLLLSSCAAGQSDESTTTVPPGPIGEVTTAGVTDAVVDDNATTTRAPHGSGGDCPEVVAVELTETAPGVFTINTTVRSVDIAGVSYADAWEVRDLDGEVYGERILTHPHPNEQPFTRSLPGVAIPQGVDRVEVAARDSVRGFCGAPMIAEVPHS